MLVWENCSELEFVVAVSRWEAGITLDTLAVQNKAQTMNMNNVTGALHTTFLISKIPKTLVK